MANPEHVKILQEGLTAWNTWREKNPHTSPDLIEAELRGVELRGADLMGVNLTGADFSGAVLMGVNLTGAHLSGANLIGATLLGADLYGADLTGANLTEADLSGAILTGADLTGANLNGAVLFETVFANTNLKNATGLESCQHHGPSTLDHRTFQQSGRLPLPFLRGCGLPDTLIEYLPSLLTPSAIQFYSCFISYSSKDEAFAKRLHADLQDHGVRCWFAPEDLKIGEKIRQTLHDSIRLCDRLLLILSEHSLASTWVESEVEAAFDKERRTGKPALFPIRLDDVVMNTDAAWASDVRKRHIGDFTNWKNHDSYQEAFDRLMRDLKDEQEPTG